MAFLADKQKCLIMNNNLAFHREGNGVPIVFIHGITTYSFLWRNIAPLLRDQHEIIAYDLLGCGDSDKPLDVSYSALVDENSRQTDSSPVVN